MQAKQRVGLTDATTFIHKTEYYFLPKKEKKPALVQENVGYLNYNNTLFNKTKIL